MMKDLYLAILVAMFCTLGIRAEIYVNNIRYQIDTAGNAYVDGYKSGSNLGALNIPSTIQYQGKTYNVTKIGYGAFGYCKTLESVTLPSSVQIIEDGAFRYCVMLKSVELSPSLKKIKAYAFAASGLVQVKIPDNLVQIEGNLFSDCSNLEKVELGKGMKYISNDMFRGCKKLTTISIPKNIMAIGDRAFQDCDLHEIKLPSAMIGVEGEIFRGNHNLKKVTCYVKTPFRLPGNNFEQNTYFNGELFVPRGSLELYKSADGWKNFKSIRETNESETGE